MAPWGRVTMVKQEHMDYTHKTLYTYENLVLRLSMTGRSRFFLGGGYTGGRYEEQRWHLSECGSCRPTGGGGGGSTAGDPINCLSIRVSAGS